MSFTLHGLGISSGIAIGRAMLLSHATLEVAHLTITARQVDKEVARLDRAVEAVRTELLALKAHNDHASTAPSELMAFIDLHVLFLADPEFVGATRRIILERLCNAEWALVQQMEHLTEQFEQFDDPYLKERKYDVLQVGERIIKELLGRPGRVSLRKARDMAEEGCIIVAHDLSPADTVSFKEHRFAAFITDVGGATSHTAILARSMAIPAIVGLANARAMIRDGECLIVDGVRGVLIADPDEQILEEYRIRKEQLELEREKLKRLKSAAARTIDSVDIRLLANIELPSDTRAVLESGADGVGLFRTEFLFLGRGDMPSEDEQFEAYKKVVKDMDGKSVTIRTFDLGGDKTPDTQRTPTNPALGRRAIRLSLAEPKMFQMQLRAILRASKYGKVKLLVPMLSHARQIDSTLAAIETAKASLREDKTGFDEAIEIGGMIEIPGAALAINMFFKRLDFLSIGTNDLIQYTLAIDRSDEQVASLYDPLHPAVVMLIAHTLSSAEKAGVPVSLCGEMAGDARFTRLLIGLGLRHFSMHPSQIMSVKSRVIQANATELAPLARRILRLDETGKIKEAVEKLNVMTGGK
ncbi:phosphoenolpyruvate-protein phosphotransferase [Betaproteobacteria bacterium]|nr:phosphoenolpyruvate-protein phosphotransferase [Betaproteobacteria bacterium]GHU42604.1 phosphoenolpyruvate-protein phosphotransferase [Betaproteobacteria bacterium]